MELAIKDLKSSLAVSKAIFGCDFNESLVHQVVVAYAAGARQGTHAQKNRGEVSGSGKKAWRQKGTGRARAGSIRSPLWRSGGVTFAAKLQNYSQKVNKKMYRGALKSILSELIRQDRLLIIEQFALEEPKTKLLVQKLKEISLGNNVLIVMSKVNKNLFLASRNLYKINVCDAMGIDPISLIYFEKIVMTVDAVKMIEEKLS